MGPCSPCRHNTQCSYLAQRHSTPPKVQGLGQSRNCPLWIEGDYFQGPSNPTHLVVWLHIAGAPVPWVVWRSRAYPLAALGMQRTEHQAHQWGDCQALGVRICRGYRGAGTVALISYQLLESALGQGISATDCTAHLKALLSKPACFNMAPANLSTSNPTAQSLLVHITYLLQTAGCCSATELIGCSPWAL